MPLIRSLFAPAAIVGFNALFTTTPVHAALAPFYQSLREIETIVTDPRLFEGLSGSGAVTSIEITAPDEYTVKTDTCKVVVHVTDAPAAPDHPPAAGPRIFTLEFGPAECGQ